MKLRGGGWKSRKKDNPACSVKKGFKGASSRSKTAFTPHQSLSRRIFAWLCLAPSPRSPCNIRLLPSGFENLFLSYLNAVLPSSPSKQHAECSRRASINSYLVQRQTEWNWSIPSFASSEKKNEREEKAIEQSVQSAFSFRLSSDDLPFIFPLKTVYLHRAISVVVGYQTKDENSSR